jgi:hypothetical protein
MLVIILANISLPDIDSIQMENGLLNIKNMSTIETLAIIVIHTPGFLKDL